MENPRQIGICVGIGFVFVGIVAFAFSWDSVEPTEWGLKYNSFTKSIDNNTSNLPLINNSNPASFPNQYMMAVGT